ncbi:MAG: PQQ-binding-like beta-propeller repeat protein [Verrucomicrobiaceae bacterium]|nr:PQQ-binding-like beta-propeller repeat protein [Verrucomicrobiaceae bacterium]
MKLTLRSLLFALAVTSSARAENWPNWRGPNQDGSSPEKNLPAKFSKTEGVKWAAPLPGLSASVPVVWGDKVFITAPIEDKKQLVGLCYDANTGKELWRNVISEGDLQWDNKSNFASPSATTDGNRVVFLFANAVIASFDFSGKQEWKRDLKETHGAFGTQWTYGSSPLLDGGRLYIQVLQRNEDFDFQGFHKGTPGKPHDSYILTLDPATGKDVWKVIRPSDAMNETLESFASPVCATVNGQRQLFIIGGDCITGHDAATGKELWRWGNWNQDQNKNLRLVPSVVVGDGIALACSPKKRPVFGVKPGLSGKQNDSALAWTSDPKDFTSDVSTPAFYGGKFYVLDSDHRTITCVEPKTGKVVWTGETGSKSKFESSPTVADGKIYMTNFWGDVYVVKAGGDKFELLSVNEMGDGTKPNGDAKSCRSSIAAANGRLFIRTQDKLYCVGQ